MSTALLERQEDLHQELVDGAQEHPAGVVDLTVELPGDDLSVQARSNLWIRTLSVVGYYCC